MSEEEVNELTAKLDCYETCIEQLQREIPRYLSRINEGEKQAIGFIKAIRKVASLEGESNMQSVLFLCASKYEVLQLESKMYDNLQDYTSVTLADAKDKIIFPLKVNNLFHIDLIFIFFILTKPSVMLGSDSRYENNIKETVAKGTASSTRKR